MRFKNDRQRKAVFAKLHSLGRLKPKLGTFKKRWGGKESFAERLIVGNRMKKPHAMSRKDFRRKQQEEREELEAQEQEVYNTSTGQWEKRSVIF